MDGHQGEQEKSFFFVGWVEPCWETAVVRIGSWFSKNNFDLGTLRIGRK